MVSGFQVVCTHTLVLYRETLTYIYIHFIENPICLSHCSAGTVCKPTRDIYWCIGMNENFGSSSSSIYLYNGDVVLRVGSFTG